MTERLSWSPFAPLFTVRGAAGSRLALGVSLIGCVTVWACGGDESTGPAVVASVVVTPSTATLVSLGETVELNASALDAGGTVVSGKSFVWSSPDETIATVSVSGLVTAVADGPVTISATTDNVSGSAAVTVGQVVTSVVVTPSTPTLVSLGETVQLSASALDASGNAASGKSFVWASPDEAIATVSVSGLVTAVADGAVTISATTDNVSGSAAVSVAQAAAQLAFTTQPTQTDGNQPIAPAVEVAIQDALANTVTTATDAVTVFIFPNPGGVTLKGTTTANAVNGVATFSDVSIEEVGVGYTLRASAAGLPNGNSDAFNIILTFATVTVGDQHSCGLTTSGHAYCWGFGASGQLGDGTATQSITPVLVSGGLSFDRLDAGNEHSCTVTTGGSAYCWGFNRFGKLGDGTTTQRDAPVLVSGGHSFTSVSAFQHTCGVTTGSDAYCWGLNSSGSLGDGTTTERHTPVLVSGGLSFGAVEPGAGHTCGVTTTGTAYCWGHNGSGELGDGTTTDRLIPVLVSGGLSFTSVSSGGGYTCGVTTTSDGYCWGSNFSGELGDGTTTDRLTPVLVSGGLSFASVSAADSHTCGVTTTGDAYCWGVNPSGQLGDGTTTQRLTPTLVSGGLSFASVSAKSSHTCGLTTTGEAYCWGRNNSGTLGDGTQIDSLVPVRVVQ